MALTDWLQVILALVGIYLAILNANKVREFLSPSNSSQPNPITEKTSKALGNFADWISGETTVNSNRIPNWLVLLILIVFLFALFRR
jgi:hypothetical protein